MAIFDPSLPIVKRGPIEEIEINIKDYKAKTKQRWTTKTTPIYSVQIEMEFERCVKKFLGFCIKKEKYKKWVELPYNIYTPDFYPEFWPINIIYKEDLNKKYFLDLPEINSEEKWKEFCEAVNKNHRIILKEIK